MRSQSAAGDAVREAALSLVPSTMTQDPEPLVQLRATQLALRWVPRIGWSARMCGLRIPDEKDKNTSCNSVGTGRNAQKHH